MKWEKHRYRRLFASDLLKVDKDTENVAYDNNRAKQLNQIEKLVVEKPKVIKEKKKPVEKIIEEDVIEEPEEPKELKRSSRERKQKRDENFVYENQPVGGIEPTPLVLEQSLIPLGHLYTYPQATQIIYILKFVLGFRIYVF